MATQMHVAYSSVFMGVGILAGGKHSTVLIVIWRNCVTFHGVFSDIINTNNLSIHDVKKCAKFSENA